MNFDEAIKAHTMWKMKLTAYINHPDHSLNSTEVSSDNKCDLGRWLSSPEANSYIAFPEFAMLKNAHAAFHKEAGSIITRADKGDSLKDEIVLGSNSRYAQASGDVVKHCMSLKKLGRVVASKFDQ